MTTLKDFDVFCDVNIYKPFKRYFMMSLENVVKTIIEDGGKTPAIILGTAAIATGAYLFLASRAANYLLNRKERAEYSEGEKYGIQRKH